MARKASKSLSAAVSAEIKSKFDLNKFKSSKGLDKNVKFKEQKWIPLSPAFQEIAGVPGVPMGHISLLRGHSDTGKTTALLEAAVSAQKMGILPVFIITEMKWNWEHAAQMGLEVKLIKDDQGNIIDYEGNFIYVDRETLHTIEDVAAFIMDLQNEQKKGNLPYDLAFFWDSIGSIPCAMSVEKLKNNNEWNAGAMSTQFGNTVNQSIVMSRKESSPYTNTLICINKVWTAKAESPMGQPKMMNKGGMAMWYDATFVVTFGNVSNAGTSKIKAIKGGKQVEWGKRTNLQIDKNHVNGMQSRGKIVMTNHGFITDTDKDKNAYKKEHSDEWTKILGWRNIQNCRRPRRCNPCTLRRTRLINKNMKHKELFNLLDNIQEDQEIPTQNRHDRVLILDGLNLFFRNFAMMNMVNPDGVHIGGLGGFFRSLGAMIRQTNPTSVYVVFDGAGSTVNRKNLLSEYKGTRNLQRITNWEAFDNLEEEHDSKIDQIVRIIQYLKLLPVKTTIIDKVEADDIIAVVLAEKLVEKCNSTCFIVSSDKDFLAISNR